MDSSYPHLGKEALKQIDLPDKDRIYAIQAGTWILYPRAKQILARLEELLAYPRIHRMPNMLIVGASNNGKTNILHHFAEKHPHNPNPEGDYSIIPVLFVQAPKKPDINHFYDLILRAIGQPYAIRARDADKEREVEDVLKNIQLKVLLVDEIQQIMAGGQVKQQEFRNGLKGLGNDLKISIVCAGVEEAFNTFNTDPQLSNRFEPEFLPKWELVDEYGDLLNSFERKLPLKKPSGLRSTVIIAQKVLWMSEGILGEIHEVLKRAAVLAIKKRTEQITIEILEGIKWTMPSKRKVAPPSA
ncbi:MAG: TniB family NTP-binding protein [Gallionella sp.]|nr:TniB family NTP-binding protein [Gallionella sp.]